MTLSEFRAENLAIMQARRLEQFRHLNPLSRKGQTVFAGSSLMEHFPIGEFLLDMQLPYCIYNRGISGYISSQLLANLGDIVLDLEPSRLFINIGTNDLGQGLGEILWQNYDEILCRVREALPECTIYVMAYYPCNDADDFGGDPEAKARAFKKRNPASILAANERLKDLAARHSCRYIDVNEGLYYENGRLKAALSMDGIHMFPEGYTIVMKNLLPYLEA